MNSSSTPNPFQSPMATEPVGSEPITAEVVARTTWPAALGVICIVLGVLGAIGGAITLVTNLMFAIGSSFIPEADFDEVGEVPQLQTMLDYAVTNAVLGGFAAAIALGLLVVGVMILQRRPAARPAAMCWAGVKALLVAVTTTVAAFQQSATFEQMFAADANFAAAGDEMVGMIRTGTIIFTVAFSLAWGLALPVFLLIWFTRGKVMAQIAHWK